MKHTKILPVACQEAFYSHFHNNQLVVQDKFVLIKNKYLTFTIVSL